MEQVSPDSWRIYATAEGARDQHHPAVGGRYWRPKSTTATPELVQRIEVIAGYRDPARILITGQSSAREVSVADGDISMAGS
jgi:hypothetical protein